MDWARMAVYPSMLAVAAGAGSGRGMKMKELTEAAAGHGMTMVPGEQVEVKLAENGSTGFRWRVEAECPGVLHLEKERVLAPADAIPGEGGERMWVFTAANEGKCELRFALARSWEKAGAGKTITFSVTVAKAR